MANITTTLHELRKHMPSKQLTFQEGLAGAERLATLLLGLVNMEQPGSDMQMLAQELGIVLTIVAELALPSMSEIVNGTWFVILRGHGYTRKQRLVFARELWNVIIEGRDDLFTADDGDVVRYWTQECAEHFAASLLMPRRRVYQAWARGLRDVHRLARHFMVPNHAMDRRLRELGLDRITHSATLRRLQLAEAVC